MKLKLVYYEDEQNFYPGVDSIMGLIYYSDYCAYCDFVSWKTIANTEKYELIPEDCWHIHINFGPAHLNKR